MVYGEFNQQPQVKYAGFLTKLLPASLSSVYFTSGGSEAIEGAVKLAKRANGRQEIISFNNAYHGSTQGALSLMGDETFKNSFRPLLPGIKTINFNSAQALNEISTQTAAVIIEPVQGEAGVVKADKTFLKLLRKKCNEKGCLLIFDEIQTGFGRTGSLFAFEQYKVVPDILVIAKGMGGGMPIGAFIASQKLMNCFTNNPPLGHINTFGGNAVCVAAAKATLEVITSQKLYLRAAEIEQIILQKCKHPRIKQVRTSGALCAIDFGDETLNRKIISACIENGIISDWFLFCPSAMRICPPLVITNKQLQKTLDTLLKIIDTV